MKYIPNLRRSSILLLFCLMFFSITSQAFNYSNDIGDDLELKEDKRLDTLTYYWQTQECVDSFHFKLNVMDASSNSVKQIDIFTTNSFLELVVDDLKKEQTVTATVNGICSGVELPDLSLSKEYHVDIVIDDVVMGYGGKEDFNTICALIQSNTSRCKFVKFDTNEVNYENQTYTVSNYRSVYYNVNDLCGCGTDFSACLENAEQVIPLNNPIHANCSYD